MFLLRNKKVSSLTYPSYPFLFGALNTMLAFCKVYNDVRFMLVFISLEYFCKTEFSYALVVVFE